MIDVGIIGAGWSGLTAAARLASAGYSVEVFEKSRGAGGRSATRRRDGFSFDHGAQYFTARSEAFRRQVHAWASAGLLAAWDPQIAVFGDRPSDAGRSPAERWVGVGGMNAVLTRLAEGLPCRWQWHAASVDYDGGRWLIRSDRDETVEARSLLVTAPPRQAADLLGPGDTLFGALSAVSMQPCWAVMLGFESPPDVAFDAAFVNQGPLSWMSRNDVKPGRDSGPAWTGHATGSWSIDHLEDDAEDVADALHAAMVELAPALGCGVNVSVAHRWRYAMCDNPLRGPILADDERALAIAGDWCAGQRVEGAWISGVAAAQRLASLV